MIFIASIRAGSHVDRMWRKAGRRSGDIFGVAFRLGPGGYVSPPLESGQVKAFEGHAEIYIEITGTLPEAAVPTPAGEAPTPAILTVDDALTRTLTPKLLAPVDDALTRTLTPKLLAPIAAPNAALKTVLPKPAAKATRYRK